MRELALVMLTGVIYLMAGTALADVYKFVDGAGHVFYTDRPNHAGYKRIIKTPLTLGLGRTSRLPTSAKFGVDSAFEKSSARWKGKSRHDFAELIDAAASRYRLDPALLHAVIRAESAYNPNAVSTKGAVGLMQLMPGTALRYGVRDRLNPVENIDGGARYLSDLIDMFQSDLKLVVAAYNAGENNVKRHGNQVPPIQETRDYVVRVLDYYRRMN